MQSDTPKRDPDAVQMAKKLLRRLTDEGDQREVDLKVALERFVGPQFGRTKP